MNTVWIVMPILLVLMFLLGTDLDKKAFEGVTKNPRAILAGMTGQIILLPLIAFLIAWALKLPPVYFMGITLIACCPGGSSSNVFSMLAKGDVALSVTLTAISSIVTLFTLPFIMEAVATFVSDHSDATISLPIGKLRIRQKGSAGGHNGLKSIIACLNSENFPRIRIGAGQDVSLQLRDYVLKRPSKDEQATLAEAYEKAADAAALIRAVIRDYAYLI